MEKELLFHIECDGIVLSNIPNNLIEEIEHLGFVSETVFCANRNCRMHHRKLKLSNGFVYLRSYASNITNRIFEHYFDALLMLHEHFFAQMHSLKQLFIDDVHRLQHNINTYNAKIQSDLDALISLEDVKTEEWNGVVKYAEHIIQQNVRQSAVTILKVIKNISLVNAEMNIYDILEDSTKQLSVYQHPIHKVVKLSLQPFFMDFVDNSITLNFGHSYSKVWIDYSSMSVVLGHIWSNAVKYCRRGTSVGISYVEHENQTLDVMITMHSLKIKNEEIEELCTKDFSGCWAKRLNKNGNGIGMYYIKTLIEMNHGTFKIVPGNDFYYDDGVPYATNLFIITLRLSV